MDSCQPEQSIEPGWGVDTEEDEAMNTSASSCNTSNPAPWQSLGEKRKLFVPIHETGNKIKRTKECLLETMNTIQNALANDPTKDLITFLERREQTPRGSR